MSPRELKVENLGAHDVRPCDFCGGAIAPIFYVIDVRIASFNPGNVNHLLGMDQYFGGKAPQIAEIFAPGADAIVQVCDDIDARTRLFACVKCYTGQPLDLAIAADARAEKLEAEENEEGVEP